MKLRQPATLLFWATLLLLTACGLAQLDVTCSFTVDGETLDLSSLGQVQTAYKQWTFIYTPCSNSLQCNNMQAMAIQDNQGSCTAYLALFLSTVEPTLSLSKGGTWEFNYANGDTANCDNQPRKLNLYFICSSSSASYDPSTTYVEEGSEQCTYDWYIYTQYACVGSIPSNNTNSTNNNCEWTTYNGYTLDLSLLKGAIGSYNDSINNRFYYYTPCMNGITCYQNNNELQMSMITQNNINGFCVSYLAQFIPSNSSSNDNNSSTQPSYSNNAFLFHYTNGESSEGCNNQNRELYLKWQCDKSLGWNAYVNVNNNGNSNLVHRILNKEFEINKIGLDKTQDIMDSDLFWSIVSVEEVVTCAYEIVVNSSLACVTNDTNSLLLGEK